MGGAIPTGKSPTACAIATTSTRGIAIITATDTSTRSPRGRCWCSRRSARFFDKEAAGEGRPHRRTAFSFAGRAC
jgi:hypothetical protein